MREVLVIWILCLGAGVQAASSRGSKSGSKIDIVFTAVGRSSYTTSAADRVTGATYTRKYTLPLYAEGSLGAVLFGWLYLGAAYDYWFYAGRTFTVGASVTQDTLRYQSIGGEIGFVTMNPRIVWILTGGIFVPLQMRIDNSSGDVFTSTTKPYAYRVRVGFGIRLSPELAFYVDGGYRYMNLGNLTSASGPYLAGSADFNLSGPFAGVGFLILL